MSRGGRRIAARRVDNQKIAARLEFLNEGVQHSCFTHFRSERFSNSTRSITA